MNDENDQNREEYEVQRELYEMSPDIGKISLALSKAQGDIVGAAKGSENPFFKSRYADLAQVWDACRDALSVNELAVIQLPGRGDESAAKSVTLTTLLTHSSGQWFRSVNSAMPMKQDAQAVGSVTTYLRRYSLAAMVGVAQVDDDGEAAVARSKAQISPAQVDHKKAMAVCNDIIALIDSEYVDSENYQAQKATVLRNKLTNDERIYATEQLKDKKPEGSGKSYASVFKEVLKLEKDYKNAAPPF